MLRIENSRVRQTRLGELLVRRDLDAAVLGLPHHAYYFSAHLPFWRHEGAFVLFADGKSLLVAAACEPGKAAADEILPFDAHYMYTLRQEQPQIVAGIVKDALAKEGAGRIGTDSSAVTAQLRLQGNGKFVSIDEDLWRMRRQKDPDELESMETAVACAEAMHARAREIVRPGVSELEVYGELHSAAVRRAGEPLSAWLGNDYRCGGMGGPPRRDRPAQAGEIYILDVGPAYRGYFADNARSYSVDGNPTPAQTKAWETLIEIFPLVEKSAKPGVRCRDLYDLVADHLRRASGTEPAHHVGHGVGLEPHEYPHLNPKWDDILLEGEVFTLEPGLYSAELSGGLRIENQYLVTRDGVRNLLTAPMDL